MNTTLKIYDKIRALAGSWEMYHNGIKWNTVFRNGEILRGRIEQITYENEYFTIESLEDNNTVTFKNETGQLYVDYFSYSTDNGATWTSGSDTTSWSINNSEKVLLKSNSSSHHSFSDLSWRVLASKTFKVYGNIMSMIYGDNYIDKQSFPLGYTYNFYHFFYNSTNLVDASNLYMPATTLTDYCYQGMFSGCTSLVHAPELPATTLAYSCYAEMFYECTSLEVAPSLPATTLAGHCYSSMFEGCTSLVVAPSLPATTLAGSCYYAMFYGCTSLVKAPSLPATTLAISCYEGMFMSCTSLTKAPSLEATTLYKRCYVSMFFGCASLVTAPVLPATTLVESCYQEMFEYCTSLKSITCYATDRSASNCLNNWVFNVYMLGDFYKKDTSWTATGNSQIPAGWTQHNI